MAVTVSLSNTKIDVTSTGGVQEPLELIYQAVIAIDATRMTRSGSGIEGEPYIYTIPPKSGQVYCEFEISSGCKVLFQNSGSNYSKLQWTWGSTSGIYTVFDMATGSEIEVEAGFEFDFDTAGTHRGYAYWWGKSTLSGSSGNEIILKHMRSNYFYPRDDFDWDYVKIQDVSYSTGYMVYMGYDYHTDKLPTCSFDNITVENTNANYWGRIYLGHNATVPLDNRTFNNWHVEHLDHPLYNISGNVKISNSTFKDCKGPIVCYSSGNGIGLPFNTSKTQLVNNKTFQPMTVFDNCVIDDIDHAGISGNGVYGLYCFYGGRVLWKDGEIKNQDYGARVSQGGLVFWQGTTTFTNIDTANKMWTYNGTHLHVFSLGLTVNDINGSPIENAAVSIIQQSVASKEWHAGLTNSNGQLKNVWGDNPVFVEKEETSEDIFEQWSDSIDNSRYHQISVSKSGYRIETRNIEFTDDITMEIVLKSQYSGKELSTI